jgi:hypothetical protein
MSARKSYFSYTASGSAFGGMMTHPNQVIIPSQGAVCVTGSGGDCECVVENYEIPGIVSVAKAVSKISASGRSSNVLIRIEGMKWLNRLEVDEMVMGLTSELPGNSNDFRFYPMGCSITGLRVDGSEIKLQNKADEFCRCPTYADLDKAQGNGALKGMIFAPNSAGQDYNGKTIQGAKSRFGDVAGTLFPLAGIQSKYKIENGGVRVDEFGTIYLGEMRIRNASRQITMLRVEFGCHEEGSGSGGRGSGNGHEYP